MNSRVTVKAIIGAELVDDGIGTDLQGFFQARADIIH